MSQKIDISDMFEFKELAPEECFILKDALIAYKPYLEFTLGSLKHDKTEDADLKRKVLLYKLNKIDYLLTYL